MPSALGDDGDGYRAAIEERAKQAKASGDVKAMVECAFAFYPLELKSPADKSRYGELLNKAADITLSKKDAALAGQFLELTSPLASSVSSDKRTQIETLATGKTPAEAIDAEAEKVAPNLKKYGPDLGDPNIKGRGDAEKELAEALGTAVLVFLRPSCILADKQPYMKSHTFSRPADNRINLTVNMWYYGAFTGNPYDAVVKFKFSLGRCFEILSINYYDDNLIPIENLKHLDSFIEELNKKLCSK